MQRIEETDWSMAPFDIGAPGDCILQSCDGRSFMVAKIILTLASPVFRDMFEMPQPTSPSEPTEKPVIRLEENHLVLRNFLLVIYPGGPPDLTTMDDTLSLVEVCTKYETERSRLVAIVRPLILTSTIMSDRPLHAFGLAWRFQLEEEMRLISRYTHRENLSHTKTRTAMICSAGSLVPLFILYDIREEKQRAVDKILEKVYPTDGLPMSCHKHLDLVKNTVTIKKILSSKRDILDELLSPNPEASELVPWPDPASPSCSQCKQIVIMYRRAASYEVERILKELPRLDLGYALWRLLKTLYLTICQGDGPDQRRQVTYGVDKSVYFRMGGYKSRGGTVILGIVVGPVRLTVSIV